MRDILSGLCLIHEKNFIHRDLKPENILLNIRNEGGDSSKNKDKSPASRKTRYTAKIADFGLSAEMKCGVF